MKIFLIFLLPLLLLAGCASMWKGMGVATQKSLDDNNAQTAVQIVALKASVDELAPLPKEIEELRAKVDDMAVTVDENKTALLYLARIKEVIADLQGRMDLLPADTLRTLAEILSKAAAALSPADCRGQLALPK